MKRLFLVVLAVFFACSIAQAQGADPGCEGKTKVAAHIRYGDSKIEVDPKVKVRKGNCIVLKLLPEKKKTDEANVDYETAKVEIVGKDDDDKWLNKTISYSELDLKKFYIPVPEDQAEGTYHYYVIVEKVGKIDPRVDVLP